jgi:hypothetical protein
MEPLVTLGYQAVNQALEATRVRIFQDGSA